MRTKEFIKRVEELGLEAWISGSIACVLKDGRYEVARIKTNRACAIDFFYPLNETLDKEISEKLFDIIVEYAKTPIEDREEEKRFYLRHRRICSKSFYLYLQKLSNVADMMSVRVFDFSGNDDIKFSEKEIEEIKKKFDTDLKDFELVEVEE